MVYVPPPFGTGTRKAAIRPTYKVREPEDSPSPAHYRPVTQKEVGTAQKFTMHGPKEKFIVQNPLGPSGADYSADHIVIKEKAPIYTIKGAKYDPEKDRTGEYLELGSTLKGPKYTMKTRPNLGVVYN
jgi:hypothetical protein